MWVWLWLWLCKLKAPAKRNRTNGSKQNPLTVRDHSLLRATAVALHHAGVSRACLYVRPAYLSSCVQLRRSAARFLAVVALLAAATCLATASSDLSLAASAGAAGSARKPWLMRLTLVNNNAHTLVLNVRQSLADVARNGALRGQPLGVVVRSASGAELPYVGMVAKRVPLSHPAAAADLVELAPGAVHAVTVDLASGFMFRSGEVRHAPFYELVDTLSLSAHNSMRSAHSFVH